MQSKFWTQVLRVVFIFLAMGVIAGSYATLTFQQSEGLAPLSWSAIGTGWLIAAISALVTMLAPISWWVRLSSAVLKLDLGFGLAILIGLSLRLAVALIVSPLPTSDGASYLALAQQLVSTGSYGTDGARAFWPPGLPLALAPLIWAGIPSHIAVLLYGLLSYLIAALGIYRLGQRLRLQSWAMLPLWMLTLWPSHILCTGLPEKELLVIALMPWIVERGIAALRGSVMAVVSAGALTGMAVLVQPSLQFLPIAGTLIALLLSRNRTLILAGGALSLAVMLVIVSPWTYRNYLVFGAPVLVSSNGGDVLYRANNDLATGAYTPKATVALQHLDELLIDKESKKLASEWIKSNPVKFVQLSMGKVLLFLGDDSYGTYAALRKGKPDTPHNVYLAAKLVSALPWIATWFLMLTLLLRRTLNLQRSDLPEIGLVLTPLLYLLAIHSLFESGPKYHLPTLPLVLILFVVVARVSAERVPISTALNSPHG